MIQYICTDLKGGYLKSNKFLYIPKRIIVFAVLFLVFLFSNVQAATVEQVKKSIIDQSVSMGVDPAIMLSIAKAESGFRQEARGAGGHVGVFQLMPGTAKRLGVNPYNLDDNIKGGILYYKSMYKTFGSMELAVAAYNTGPDAIKRCNNTIPKHARGFVSRIMTDYKYYKSN